jgi:uridine phosphorylase
MKKPHIHLSPDRRFQRAIVCGSPERAALIANCLEGAESVAKNREYHSYLGKFKNKDILVTSHGVGSAGAAICFNELIDIGVQVAIRIGTAGGLKDDSKIGDLVIPTAAIRRDGVTGLMIPVAFPAVPDFGLTSRLILSAESAQVRYNSGIVLTSDLFYPSLLDSELPLYQKANAIAVEMECSALFIIGSLRGAKTAAILAIDGNPLRWNQGDYDPVGTEVGNSINHAISVALNALIYSTT